MTDYPTLSCLLGCYFHQDWSDEAETAAEVINVFLEADGAEIGRKACEDIDRLLQSDHQANELGSILFALGSEYDPEPDGLSAYQWLLAIRKQLGCGEY